ncbi:MAG: hypothetical protein ACO28Y_04615 [Bacteroidia bacterium]
MKNILIGLLVIIFFTACVSKSDICESPKITGDFIVKESYPEQDSVRISTKNIRINNKTITEFKNLAHIKPKDIFALNLYNYSNNNPLNPQYIINDTSINFKIPSGQYQLYYPYLRNSKNCANNYSGTSYTFNVLAPKTKCRITKIEINSGTANGFNQLWDPADGPDTYVAINTNGTTIINLKSKTFSNVQLQNLPLVFTLNIPYEIGNSITNVFKNLDIVLMDDDTPNTDQQMGSALFNANLQLITNYTESVSLSTMDNAFTITLYFDYVS